MNNKKAKKIRNYVEMSVGLKIIQVYSHEDEAWRNISSKSFDLY
jgi:hypothetical protein